MNARILALMIAFAGFPGAARAEALAGHAVVASEELDRMRGGFTASVGGSAFEVSFGIDKAVFVNGELVAASKLTAAGLTPSLLVNSIQNSLDNQVIKQMTVIDAKVRSLEAFAANRFGAALNQQILGSLR